MALRRTKEAGVKGDLVPGDQRWPGAAVERHPVDPTAIRLRFRSGTRKRLWSRKIDSSR